MMNSNLLHANMSNGVNSIMIRAEQPEVMITQGRIWEKAPIMYMWPQITTRSLSTPPTTGLMSIQM